MSRSSKQPVSFVQVKDNPASTTKTVTLAKILDIDFFPHEVVKWEVRPGGMLVQNRHPELYPAASTAAGAIPPPIHVLVKHGSICHDLRINPLSSFGELKKLLAAETGLRPMEMKLVFKDREMDRTAFLDVAGVKNNSKLCLIENPTAQTRRVLETRRNAKVEKAQKLIEQISFAVDRLALQVSALESLVGKGSKVPERDVLLLIEHLMNRLIELDDMTGIDDGYGITDTHLKTQVRRVQKLVETVDVLKIKNSTLQSAKDITTNNTKAKEKEKEDWEYEMPCSTPETSSAAGIETSNPALSSTVIKPIKASSAARIPKVSWKLF